MSRPRVAIVHPRLGFGGSEAAALWAVQALKGDYSVSLITSGTVDLERLNEYYGTRLDPREFPILLAPQPFGLASTQKFAALRGAFLLQFCRKVESEFDLIINTYGGPGGWNTPTIQLIADFAFMEDWRFKLHPELRNHRGWWYGDTLLRKAYLRLCRTIAPPIPDAWARTLVLANSHWTGRMLREHLSVEAGVLYPPVTVDSPEIPWEERENGFVWIGRVVPEKRLGIAIEILRTVRKHGHDVHLHILGGVDNSPYAKRTKQLCCENSDWIFLEGYVAGDQKKLLIARHRFGIHSRANEPFGLAVAEMVKAGCIVFVPNGGGQVEIVNHPALMYKDDDAAVRKIEAVLADSEMQESLRSHLSQGARRFSVENFTQGIRKAASEFLREEESCRKVSD
jgi:glycosyltransferase involved in cell wall biosynthesis